MPTSRRDFLKTASAAAAGLSIVPRHVLGGPGYQAPSDTMNVAAIGAGGRGESVLQSVASENVVALCDVDWERASTSFERFPDARRYRDFRVMLEEESGLDGILIATPDHTHAVAAAAAMKRGLHVYVEKPLTTTVAEARYLNRLADETGVTAQMGNQGRSMDGGRRVNEWIRAGVIGNVEEVHAWTNRPIWPQGVEAPSEPEDLPDDVAWDLFLGPAQYRQYHSAYHPFRWRGWIDFGSGALGDMGAHLMDHAIWALELGYPTEVETHASGFTGDSFPHAELVHFTFEHDGRELPLTWYDGGLMPPVSRHLPDDAKLKPIGMVMYVGEDGVLLHESYGRNPRVFPNDLQEEAEEVDRSIPRVASNHGMNWVNAVKGSAELTSPFSVGAPVTETMLLGVVSLRAGTPVVYDGEAGRVTNNDDANAYLSRDYRECWELEG
jgi:predicted dehydrogenase